MEQRTARAAEHCYMCGATETSRDHVPAKTFFPKIKDVGGKHSDLRNNLLTVPACPKHNQVYSKDEEYVGIILTCHYPCNEIAFAQFDGKHLRALRRNPRLLSFYKNRRRVVWDGKETMAFQVELPRFERVMDKIARALYWRHTSKVYRGPSLIVAGANFLTPSNELSPFAEIDARIDWAPMNDDFCGNARIFRYRYLVTEDFARLPIFRFTFYEGVNIIVAANLAGLGAESGITPVRGSAPRVRVVRR